MNTMGKTTIKNKPKSIIDLTESSSKSLCESFTNTHQVSQIQRMPSEILFQVFKNLSQQELWNIVKPVCRRWSNIAMNSTFWTRIEADQTISSQTLVEWLKSTPYLKHLKLKNRTDTNEVITLVSKLNQNLETIEAIDCRGCNKNSNVKSKPLCSLLKRCPNIANLNLTGTPFLSCKFYKLMALHNKIHANSRIGKKKRVKFHPISFTGCGATLRQLKTFLQARRETDTDYLANLQLGNDVRWQLRDPINSSTEDSSENFIQAIEQRDSNSVSLNNGEIIEGNIDNILKYIFSYF